jgi:hypothetical protein
MWSRTLWSCHQTSRPVVETKQTTEWKTKSDASGYTRNFVACSNFDLLLACQFLQLFSPAILCLREILLLRVRLTHIGNGYPS